MAYIGFNMHISNILGRLYSSQFHSHRKQANQVEMQRVGGQQSTKLGWEQQLEGMEIVAMYNFTPKFSLVKCVTDG